LSSVPQWIWRFQRKVHQNYRVYTLDIRIMVAKVHPSHFFFCRIPKDVFKDVSLGPYTCEVLVKCLDCRNWRSKLEDEKGFAPKAKHRAHLEQTFDLQKIILTARGSKWEGPAIEYSFFIFLFDFRNSGISQGEMFRVTSRATWSSCRFKGYGVTLSCTRQGRKPKKSLLAGALWAPLPPEGLEALGSLEQWKEPQVV